MKRGCTKSITRLVSNQAMIFLLAILHKPAKKPTAPLSDGVFICNKYVNERPSHHATENSL